MDKGVYNLPYFESQCFAVCNVFPLEATAVTPPPLPTMAMVQFGTGLLRAPPLVLDIC